MIIKNHKNWREVDLLAILYLQWSNFATGFINEEKVAMFGPTSNCIEVLDQMVKDGRLVKEKNGNGYRLIRERKG